MTGSGFGEWYSGSIDIRGDWDNPYLASSPYDREYVHTGWALWVDMNPHVWVEATDAEASEDSRDEAKFSVKREGGDPSQTITVHVGFGGSATASGQPASAFPEGIAFNGEADYTVEGATYDPDTGGWTVAIPAGQTSADVTVKPLNDPAQEEAETIQLSLAGDPDGVDGGEYALAAPHPGTTNPASKPATATATLKGLVIYNNDPNEQLPADATTGLAKLKSGVTAEENAGDTLIRNVAAERPTAKLRSELDAIRNGNYSNNAKNLATGILDDIFSTYDVQITGNMMSVTNLPVVAGRKYRIKATAVANVKFKIEPGDLNTTTSWSKTGEAGGQVPSVPLIPTGKGFANIHVEVFYFDEFGIRHDLNGHKAGNCAFEVRERI